MRQLLVVGLLSTALIGLAACERNANTTGNPSSTGNAGTTDNPSNAKPDNTGVNKRDQNTATPTPMNQGEDQNDLRITADIRKAVTDDGSLSTNAHNAKIITNNGAVVLRGPVDSAAEKSSIETKAKNVAGVTSVENQLEVKNP